MIHPLAQSQKQKYEGTQCSVQVWPSLYLQNDSIQQESAAYPPMSPKAVAWKHKHEP